MPICLQKQGFSDLYLQAVKCHAASSERKTVAKPRPIYAILSNILIEIMVEDSTTHTR
jgi:hypothetical protein